MRPSFIVATLLVAFWAMAISVSPRVGATADERVHLVGGYSYWTLHDYRLQPENGNLTMRLEALPLLARQLRFPSLDTDYFRTARANDVGHEFLFGSENPFALMLRDARAVVGLFGVLTLWLVWRWTRHLFGETAGCFAVAIGSFCPALLAHAGLATSDAAITAALFGGASACWLLLHRVTLLRLAIAIAAVAAALLAKFSGVLLGPIVLLLLVARWIFPAPLPITLGRRTTWIRNPRARIAATLGLMGATAAMACVLVWAAYGFRYSAFNPSLQVPDKPAPQLAWSHVLPAAAETRIDLPTRAIAWARAHRVLPEAYLYGFADSYKGSRRRPAFLMGETSTTGWPQFFPIAFLLKTPPSELLLALAGIAAVAFAAFRRRSTPLRWPRRGWLYRTTPLLVLFCIYWAVAIATPLNIGHRHLLPVYPAIYVFIGAATGWLLLLHRQLLVMALLVVVSVIQIADSWGARPFYLAYFTPWIGTERGWHYLVDSSLDWGQGLPDLARWIKAKEATGDRTPIFLTYFGTDSPEARKLSVTRFGDLVDDLAPRHFPAQVRGGWFVISATHFQGVYLNLDTTWTTQEEARYRDLLRQLSQAPANISSLSNSEREPWARAAQDYERLQYGRLRNFLLHRPPEAFIGASLLVFRLTDADVQQALYAPVSR